jgi:hypothetical protein
MEIYTIGFTQTTAERFFTRLADARIERLLDVRLNNTSQLAGFAKAQDLPYFASELADATYEHEPSTSPCMSLLEDALAVASMKAQIGSRSGGLRSRREECHRCWMNCTPFSASSVSE